MAAEDRDVEIERLKGRIAALEGICAALLSMLVQGDAAARRSIADDIRGSVERINAVSEGAYIYC